MSKVEDLARWIEQGKQVGNVFSFQKDGQTCWCSVAIQKWDSSIKVYVDEILESQMDAENYLREEILKFDSVSQALDFVSRKTKVSLDLIKPCKGQKIFNPAFD